MVNEKSNGFRGVSTQLSTWLEDIKQHEVTRMVEVVEQAKLYAKAAESIPEEKIGQFIDNLTHDLAQFYHQLQADSKHSIYLQLLNESWWSTLAEMTDKSQVEWTELADDFAHDGIYRAGDYIGFGELECQQCHQTYVVTHFSQAYSCPECGHDVFKRNALAP